MIPTSPYREYSDGDMYVIGEVTVEKTRRMGSYFVSLLGDCNSIGIPNCNTFEETIEYVRKNYADVFADVKRVNMSIPSDYYADNSRYYGD